MPNRLQFVVSGTGRSGTVYMARLLTSLGLMCGHESVFDHDGLEPFLARLRGDRPVATSQTSVLRAVETQAGLAHEPIDEWFDPSHAVAESSYLGAPYLAHPALDGVRIVHVVRNPWHVVSSFCAAKFLDPAAYDFWKPYVDFIASHVAEIARLDDPVERTCLYYVRWNELVERNSAVRPYLRVRVEQQPSAALHDFLGVPAGAGAFSDTKVNTWGRRERDLGPADVPPGPIKDAFLQIVSRYGYPDGVTGAGIRPRDASAA